jgi:16S rRNA (guanine527-N7)-methyltransferase
MSTLKQILELDNIEISSLALKQLETFTTVLQEWNKIHNLTGAKTAVEVEKNIEDSLFPTTFIEKPSAILDVGTGAGFPGLILAIAYPDVRTVLCEPRKKRASFLKYVAMELELDNVEVVKKRVEDYSSEPFGLISSRAVTDTNMLLRLTEHLQDKKSRYLFYKGEQLFSELESVGAKLDYDIVEKNKRNYLYIKGFL